jgi:predicted dehydrogenase
MKTYVLAGASKRSLEMFAAPIQGQFADTARLVGVFDVNPGRAAYLSRECGDIPAFDDFDRMIREVRPDCVIVVTMDRYHQEYIVRALDAGCEVITEKPMVIDDEQCRAVLAAEQRSGKAITVTFNYRFMPYVTRVKELLRQGAIGRLLNIDFEWYLDRKHGADYFRRWHRRKENSGGLLVTKATHHFDMINWWLDDDPERVEALGRLQFYGPTRAERGDRCSTCAFTQTCEFYVDLPADPFLKTFYFDAEQFDGYHRDQCVFADEINIEDTMNVAARYKHGAQLSYSLVAYSPYEGWRATLTGTKGRMELREDETGPLVDAVNSTITVCDANGNLTRHDIPRAEGDHGGGDEQILERLFGGRPLPDPLGHMAGSWAGAMSILIGAAANRSIAMGESVTIADLLQEPSPL